MAARRARSSYDGRAPRASAVVARRGSEDAAPRQQPLAFRRRCRIQITARMATPSAGKNSCEFSSPPSDPPSRASLLLPVAHCAPPPIDRTFRGRAPPPGRVTLRAFGSCEMKHDCNSARGSRAPIPHADSGPARRFRAPIPSRRFRSRAPIPRADSARRFQALDITELLPILMTAARRALVRSSSAAAVKTPHHGSNAARAGLGGAR